jgi:hypothetical protein
MDAKTITLWTTDDRNVYFGFGTNMHTVRRRTP